MCEWRHLLSCTVVVVVVVVAVAVAVRKPELASECRKWASCEEVSIWLTNKTTRRLARPLPSVRRPFVRFASLTIALQLGVLVAGPMACRPDSRQPVSFTFIHCVFMESGST